MKQSRFTDEQIIGFLNQADAGTFVKELLGLKTAMMMQVLTCAFQRSWTPVLG
jgi:hypothetical protein